MTEQTSTPTQDPKTKARQLPHAPGVYRMLDTQGRVLYVGKARNLRRRVDTYFARGHDTNPRIATMVRQIADIEITVTRTEGEALLLENQLIKSLRPRYNVLLRDDKSYPYIYLSSEDRYPRLAFHRGARNRPGQYFGPFPSAGAVRESLNLLQKAFQVRQCTDSFFKNRGRPCLQYHIKRCTAPCVGYIDEDSYQADVRRARLFLEGHSTQVIEELIADMETASAELRFEDAARLRDRIATLRRIQERQYVSGASGDMDILACAMAGGVACVLIVFIRAGHNVGQRSFYPSVPEGAEPGDVLNAFVPQYYVERAVPGELLVSHPLHERALLEEVLGEQAGHKVRIAQRPRGERAKRLDWAKANAEQALSTHLASRGGVERRLEALQDALGLDRSVSRVECFDVSHTMGDQPVASCVVFDADGFAKSDYRRFNIRGVEPGDDYAALSEALERRYRRLKEGEGKLPDLLLIDGGKGQLKHAMAVMEELQVAGVQLAAVAKGAARRPGDEQLFLPERDGALRLAPDSPALHLIQSIRDEAHRFAITGHRQRRGKAQQRSKLEDIEGIGPKRRQRLLKHFGGLQGVAKAGVEELAAVPGVDRALARRIYEAFQGESLHQ